MIIRAQPLTQFPVAKSERLIDAAKNLFGARDCWIIRVPARLCLAADHTDYWEVFSPHLVTFASDSCTMQAVISPRSDSLIRMYNMGDFDDCEFDIRENSPPLAVDDFQWLDWLELHGTPEAHWSNYVRGPVHHAQMYHDVKNGFDILIDSNIPHSSGASSSSALTICAAVAIRLANGLNLDQVALAKDTADAEWYVGTRGGMMDHATMIFAEPDDMLQLTFRPFSATTLKTGGQLDSCKFVTIFTHPSDKGTSTQLAFNARALAAREIIPELLLHVGYKITASLDDVPIQQLPSVVNISDIENRILKNYPALQSHGDWDLQLQDWMGFAAAEYRRSWDVVRLMTDEMGRVQELGDCMNQAWNDAGELYGIRTSQMDMIANLCHEFEGVLGIKVMGAGFGGNILALVEENSVGELRDLLQKNAQLFSRPVDDSMIVHGLGSGVSILTGPEGDMNWAPLWRNEEV